MTAADIVSKPRRASPPRIVISINSAWNIANFRAGLIRALKAEGCAVIAVAPFDAYAERLVAIERTALLPGWGVDLDRFKPIELTEQQRTKDFRFLLIARLLYDKGVGEYAKAVRIVKAERPELVCGLLGFLDAENRTAVTR